MDVTVQIVASWFSSIDLNNKAQYLHYTRTSKAFSDILYMDQSITDIAFGVGYHDSNYFSTKFKQVFNQTPREARMRHSGN